MVTPPGVPTLGRCRKERHLAFGSGPPRPQLVWGAHIGCDDESSFANSNEYEIPRPCLEVVVATGLAADADASEAELAARRVRLIYLFRRRRQLVSAEE